MRACKVLLLFACIAGPGVAQAERCVSDQGVAATGADSTADLPNGDVRDGLFRITDLGSLSINNYDTGNNAGESRGAIEFPVNAFPKGATVTGAYLTFPAFFAGPSIPLSLRVDGYLGNGAIGIEDFAANNRIGTMTVLHDREPSGSVSINITGFVRQMMSFNQLDVKYLGFTFRSEEVNTGSITLYHNFQFQDQPHAVLAIDYTPATVPEPSGIVLAACAGAAVSIVALRRRR